MEEKEDRGRPFGLASALWVGVGPSSSGLKLALRSGVGPSGRGWPFLLGVGVGPSGWGRPFLLEVRIGQLLCGYNCHCNCNHLMTLKSEG